MTQQPKNTGWLCLWCRVMNGKHALCCHRCGGKWYEVGEDTDDGNQAYAQWHQSPRRRQAPVDNHQRPKSPRQTKGKGRGGYTPSPRPKQNRHRRGKKPAETSAHADAQQAKPPALPDAGSGSTSWLALLQMQQAANQAAQASQEASNAAPSTMPPQQSAAMRQLLTSLKKDQEKLSPENQELVKTLTVKEEKNEEKELQIAAKDMGKARRDLQEAFEARSNLHQKWRTFLSMSVALWQTFTTEFQQQESAANLAIQAAKDSLALAKQNLETSKEAFQSPRDARQASEVHDLMSDEDNQEDQGAQKLQEGLQHLTTFLQDLHKAAEDAIAVENASKKARLSDATDVSGLPGGKALQPFGVPGTTRP